MARRQKARQRSLSGKIRSFDEPCQSPSSRLPTLRASTWLGRGPARHSLRFCAQRPGLGETLPMGSHSPCFFCTTSRLGRNSWLADDTCPDVSAGSLIGTSRPFSQARFLFQAFSPKPRQCGARARFPVPKGLTFSQDGTLCKETALSARAPVLASPRPGRCG